MNKAFAVSLLTVSLLACAVPEKKPAERTYYKPAPKEGRLVVSPRIPKQQAMSVLYQKAEKLYARGLFYKAAQVYLRFIAESRSNHPLLDNAYFKVGMSWFEIGRYRDAQHYFSAIGRRFPKSEVFTEALINSAICQFHLNDLNKAGELFNQAASLVGNLGHKAYIFFYQGNIAEKKSDFLEAADFYIIAERMAQNNELVDASRAKLSRIFHNFLGEGELLAITELYSSQWPAKLAFEELIRIYDQINDPRQLARVKGKYRTQFPPGPGKKERVFNRIGDDSYAPDQIKIGAVLPFTGEGAATGREIVQGIQLAFNVFHKLIREKNIQLIIKDSGRESGDANEAIEQLAKDRDTLLILGPVYSKEFENAADISEKYRIPLLSPSATAEGAARLSDYLFRNALTNSLEAKKMAEMAVTRLGLKKFAILYPDDNYGRQLKNFFAEEAQRLGGEVIVSETYDPNQTDFGEQMRNLGGMTDDELRRTVLAISKKDPEIEPWTINEKLVERFEEKLATPKIITYGKPPLTMKNFLPGLTVKYDAIFLPGLYHKVGLILPELVFYNIKGISKLAGKGVNHPDFYRIAEKYSDGVIFLDGFFSGSDSASVRSFVRDYHLYFHDEPTILSAQAYDAAMIALSALAHGANSRKSITDYLRSLKFFEGVTGITNMTPDGDADKSVFFLTMNKGKIIEYKAPEALDFQSGEL